MAEVPSIVTETLTPRERGTAKKTSNVCSIHVTNYARLSSAGWKNPEPFTSITFLSLMHLPLLSVKLSGEQVLSSSKSYGER